jgi:hypothetical protein
MNKEKKRPQWDATEPLPLPLPLAALSLTEMEHPNRAMSHNTDDGEWIRHKKKKKEMSKSPTQRQTRFPPVPTKVAVTDH